MSFACITRQLPWIKTHYTGWLLRIATLQLICVCRADASHATHLDSTIVRSAPNTMLLILREVLIVFLAAADLRTTRTSLRMRSALPTVVEST